MDCTNLNMLYILFYYRLRIRAYYASMSYNIIITYVYMYVYNLSLVIDFSMVLCIIGLHVIIYYYVFYIN